MVHVLARVPKRWQLWKLRRYAPKAALGKGGHTKVTRGVVCWAFLNIYVPMHGEKPKHSVHYPAMRFEVKFPAQPSS